MNSITPLTMTLPDAVRYTGLSRSTLYRLLQQEKIIAINTSSDAARGRTLFVVASLVAYVASCRSVVPTGKL